jgi:hypothetical protein
MVTIAFYLKEQNKRVLYIKTCKSVSNFWQGIKKQKLNPSRVQVLGPATKEQSRAIP